VPGPGGCPRIPAHRRIVAVVRGSTYGVIIQEYVNIYVIRRIVREQIAVI
jgi:hypothetical protein